MTGDQTPPAGWYPDNSVDAPAGQQRYWDGSEWSEQTTTVPTVAKPAPPAGWYPDQSVGAPVGQQRYWNGSAWTARTAAPTTALSTAPTVDEPARKPGILTRWGIPALVGVLAFLFGVGIGAAGGSTAEPTSAPEPTPAPTVTVDPSAAREAELDKIAADLDQMAAEQATVNEELAAKEAELEAREQAVSAAEQEQAVVPPASEPEPVPETDTGAEVWNLPGPDLDCSDIGHPVTITGPDYHGLDADGDGIGCEG